MQLLLHCLNNYDKKLGGEVLMKRYCYICGYKTTDKNMYTCPECLCDDVFVQTKEEEELFRLLNNRELVNAMIKLKQNDPIEYQLKLN